MVAGEDKDGFPSETSERVRVAAEESLQNCISRSVGKEPAQEPREQPEPATPQPPELPGTTRSSFGPKTTQRPMTRLEYYEIISSRPLGRVVADARRTLSLARSQGLGQRSLTTGHRSLYGALARATAPNSQIDHQPPVLNLAHEGEAGPQPSPPVLNLAHDGEPGPQQSPGPQQTSLAGMPPERAQAELGRPDDVSVNQTSHGESSKDPRPRSVFQLIRRSLHPGVESQQDGPAEARQ